MNSSMRDQLLKSFAEIEKRKLSSKDNNKNEKAKNQKKEVPKKDFQDKNTKNVNPKLINTSKPINPFIQNNKKYNFNTFNTTLNNQKQSQNNNTNSNMVNNNKPKEKKEENSNFKKALNVFNNKINNNNLNTNNNYNNNKTTNPTPLTKQELKSNNPEKKVYLSRSTAISSKVIKEKNNNNKNNIINKNKDNNNEENNLRKNSLTKINNKFKLEEDKTKEIKKSNSIKNQIPKINVDNFSGKINEVEKHLYEDEINDIMNINEIKGKAANIKKNVSLKRAKTSGQNNQQLPVKKRYSLLDDNNCLTIKLKSKNNFTKDDFEVETFSGKGAYGTVLQVYLKKDPKKKIYAIKKLDINSLFSVNRLYQAYLENDILNELDSPYIVKIYGAFESDGKIHLVMDYLPKGDFSYFIKTNFPLKEDIIRFYSAEIVLFLEYMQKMNLVHRDLKPQNIMIDEKGHLKVIDFGTVRKLGYYYDKKEMRFKEEKIFERIDSEDIKGIKNIVNPDLEDADEDDYDEDEEDEEEENEENENNEFSEKKQKKLQKARVQRSMTFVGTAEYISPEVIADRPAEFGTDIWAFGVMLYQMYFNNTPFKAVTTYLTFRNIEKPQISFPNDNISEQAKDLILKILVAEPKKRLGGGEPGTPCDIEHLKKHPFFKKIKWNNMHNTTPPGLKDLKFYECKKKSIYKNQENMKMRNSDGYIVFDDKSKDKNVQIIKKGYIKKKSMWFHYEKRHIVLDSSPKITLKAINDENYLRIIPLTKKCKITLVENNCFDLKTSEKTHRFKGTENDGNDWAGVIADAITAYAKE